MSRKRLDAVSGGAGAVRDALPGRRRGAGRRRPPGRRRAAAPRSRARWSPTTCPSRSPRARATSRAAGRSSRTRSPRSGSTRPAGSASTPGRPRAASPTACSSAAREHVVALDVAYGELHWRLRNDPRVTVIERRNARELERGGAAVPRPTWSSPTSRSSRSRRCCPRLIDAAADEVGLPRAREAAVRGRPRAGGEGRRRALGGRPPRGAGRGRRVGGRGTATRCSATRRPACRAPRATRRASSGSPRPAGPEPWTRSRRRRGGWSREEARARHALHAPVPRADGRVRGPAARRRARSAESRCSCPRRRWKSTA